MEIKNWWEEVKGIILPKELGNNNESFSLVCTLITIGLFFYYDADFFGLKELNLAVQYICFFAATFLVMKMCPNLSKDGFRGINKIAVGTLFLLVVAMQNISSDGSKVICLVFCFLGSLFFYQGLLDFIGCLREKWKDKTLTTLESYTVILSAIIPAIIAGIQLLKNVQ